MKLTIVFYPFVYKYNEKKDSHPFVPEKRPKVQDSIFGEPNVKIGASNLKSPTLGAIFGMNWWL